MSTETVMAIEQPGPKGTSHAVVCPTCGCRANLRFEPDMARLFGGCQHFQAIIQTGAQVEVEFNVPAVAA